MRSRADTKPCPMCGKPIKRQAPKCWFCGEVFDTDPCPNCGSPVKRSSTHCGFCAEPIEWRLPPSRPEGPRAPAPSDAVQAESPPSRPDNDPPVLEVTGNRICPRCREEIPLAATRCKYCLAVLDAYDDYGPRHRRDWGAGHVHAPHRGGTVLGLALVSLLCCSLLGPVALILAIADLRAMRTGRMDSSGEGLTWAGLVIASLSTLAALAGAAIVVLTEARVL